MDGSGKTKMLMAILAGDTAEIRARLEAGADPEADLQCGWTGLILSAGYGQEECMEEFLRAGANIEAKEPHGGKTALLLAAMKGQERLARRLLEAGADPRAKDKSGRTGEELARDAKAEGCARLLAQSAQAKAEREALAGVCAGSARRRPRGV